MAKNDELPQTTPAEIESVIKRIQASNLEPSTKEKAERLLRTVMVLLNLLERKSISIKRLRDLVFGRRTEKRKQLSGSPRKENEEDREKHEGKINQGGVSERSESERESKPDKKGHGRRASEGYAGAKKVECRHGELKAGDRCPGWQCGGRLYDLNEPKMLLQFTGQPLITATRYEQEVLSYPCKCLLNVYDRLATVA
jgi:hypothetical protein